MAITRQAVLDLVSSEEPDYRAAAEAAGTEGFAVLAAMVGEDDPFVAARAASIVALLADDPDMVDQAVPVLRSAARHDDAGVRAVAAVGAASAGPAGSEVTKICLADADPGVRYLALRSLSPPLEPGVAQAVQSGGTSDPNPTVKDKALALTVRTPDPSLANELLAQAIEYAHRRMTELRAALLGDVAGFATAAGRPGFVDVGAVVAGLLATARAALDAIVGLLAARNFNGAARQLGIALGAISDAATRVGGKPFLALLLANIGWGSATPTGLAKHLGLPAIAPGLTVADDALVYTIAVAGRSLVPAPLALGFERAQLTARLRLGAKDPVLSVSLAITGLSAAVGGGPISSLLGGAAGAVEADVVLGSRHHPRADTRRRGRRSRGPAGAPQDRSSRPPRDRSGATARSGPAPSISAPRSRSRSAASSPRSPMVPDSTCASTPRPPVARCRLRSSRRRASASHSTPGSSAAEDSSANAPAATAARCNCGSVRSTSRPSGC